MKDASAAILCGGRSSRMGFDKSLMVIHGRFVLAVMARELQRAFGEVLLVTNDPDKFAGISPLKNCRVVADCYPGKGPIGGIYTALTQSRFDRTFVIGCDMPVIDLGFLGKLYAKHDADVVIPRNGDFIEPLYAFYANHCAPAVQTCIVQGKLAVRACFPQLNVEEVDAGTNCEIFVNLNRPEDLAGIESYFQEIERKWAKID